ncbi:MAG: VWA-like domain-containing protein [Phycisphaerae bacterium]|nr:VWA-like domain-containing protein [Phycisphaerae bacterium]
MNQKLAEARILAARKMPYMTHQVMTLIPVERPGLNTMAVDEYCRLYFDPAFLEGRDLTHLSFVVLHEAIHVWSKHARRGVRLLGEKPAADRLDLWRLAVDAAVNDVLEQSGLPCPEEGVTPAKLDLPRNKSAEEYFDLLLQRAAEQQQQQQQQGESEQSSEGEGQSETGDEQSGEGEGQPDASQIGGSAADGQPRPWEDGPPSAEHPGMDEHEQNLVEAAVAKAIENYQQQRGRGSVPGGLARAAADLLRPKVDPARELLAKVKYAVGCTSGFGDFTYRKPNRRQPAGGALLPAHVKPIPRVTVVVDTSGSMEQHDLALALGVIGNALRSLPDPRGLRVLAGDTAVACAKNVFRPEQIELAGGGGTDMSAMIVAAAEERPAPKAILVVTDGYTGWPREPVGPRVVVCLTQAYMADSVPKWMDTVVLNPGE